MFIYNLNYVNLDKLLPVACLKGDAKREGDRKTISANVGDMISDLKLIKKNIKLSSNFFIKFADDALNKVVKF